MKDLNVNKTIYILNEILQYELAGVVKYTHFALMVAGPNRITLDNFFKAQATESLEHALQAGELLTGLGGHPSQKIPNIKETNQHSINNLLEESMSHENEAVKLYQKLLKESQEKSLYIEEYAREMIKTEEMHSLEVKKMLRDYK